MDKLRNEGLSMYRGILLLTVALTLLFTCSSLLADNSRPDSPSDVADEAFLKSHLLKQQQMLQALSSHKMTAAQHLIDVKSYEIRLAIDPTNQARVVTGAVTARGQVLTDSLDILQFDLSKDLTADSAKAAGTLLQFAHEHGIISITLPASSSASEFDVTIFYHGHPQTSGFGAFTLGSFNNKPTIATLSEPFYARDWWPCKDHPTDKADSVDIYVTVDGSLIVASNGTLMSIVDNGDGTKTTHWHESYPIATYLVSLAIADYYTYSDTVTYQGHTMPIDFFHYGEPPDWMRANNALVKDMIVAYSDLFGIYPFINEKYGQAQFNFGGGMEHQTCTSLGAFGEWVMAHELGHQWWGDMVTCGSWHEIWLNEGFASYCEALWEEHKGGDSILTATMTSFEGSWDTTAAYDRLYVDDTTSVNQIFDWREYRKGAWVLHMLRYQIGDSAFFQTLRNYGMTHRYSHALTADLRYIAETQSGLDLGHFFDQWVYQGGQPDFLYSYWSTPSGSGSTVYLHLRQTQQGFNPFKTDVDVRFFVGDAAVTVRLSDTLTSQDFVLQLPGAPDSCVIDPDNWILNSARQTDYVFNIPSTDLPAGYIGQPYRYQLAAAGGFPPYSWSAADVTLPIGLSCSASGLVSGTPTESGDYSMAVTVFDSDSPRLELTSLIPIQIRVLHGDIDGLGTIALGDLLHLLRYLYKDGPTPADMITADVNCDGAINLLDVVVLLNYLYQQGAVPCWSAG
jgi:aminopeptidase N